MPLPPRSDGLSWRRIESFERPRGPAPAHLYESGVLIELKFTATPDGLRQLVGSADRDFDAFVNARPAVNAWLEAWHRAHPPA